MTKGRTYDELELIDFEQEGEVGELVEIETPGGTIRATWLGTVSNGKQLAEAMRLMQDIAREREQMARIITQIITRIITRIITL